MFSPPSPPEFQPGFEPPTCSLRGFSIRLVAPSALCFGVEWTAKWTVPSFFVFPLFFFVFWLSSNFAVPECNLSFCFFSVLFSKPFLSDFFVQSFWCVEASFFHFFVFQPLREFSCADPFNVSDSLLKFRCCFVGFRFPFTFTLPIQPFKVFDVVFVSQRWKNQSWNMLLNTQSWKISNPVSKPGNNTKNSILTHETET